MTVNEPVLAEVTPNVGIALSGEADLRIVFGNVVNPVYVHLADRMEQCKLGAALVACAKGRPLYSRATIQAALTGAAMTVPPSRVAVTVADENGAVYEADAHEVDVYGQAETVTVALTTGDNTQETLRDVHPRQILHMEVQR